MSRYLSGSWTAVVHDGLVALVDPRTPPAAVARLWEVADAGKGVHEALVALAEAAEGDLPSFALVALSQTGVLHAALRGDADVAIGSSAGMRARRGDASSWTEVTAHDVPAVTLRVVGQGGTGVPLPLVAGVVRAAEVTVTAKGWAPPPRSEETAVEDHEGLTMVTGDLIRLRAAARATAPAAAHPGAVRQRAVRLLLSTGLVVPLDRTVLLGRAPQTGRVSATDLPRLVTVPSPHQDVSRTHARVRREGEHVVVTDLDSLNGVRVTPPGGAPRRLHPGEPTVVAPGDVVDLGDGVTFTVENGA